MDMEDQKNNQPSVETNQVNSGNEMLVLTPEIKTNLNKTGKWSNFLAILGFIFTALIIVGGFFATMVMSFLPTGDNFMPFPSFLFGLIYLVIGIVYFLPILYLYRFSSGIRQALRLNDQNKLSNAFLNLKAHYRFIGILTIVFLCIYILLFVGLFTAGLFTGFSNFVGTQV